MPPKKKQTKADSIDDLLKKYEGVLFKGNSDELYYERIPFNITALDALTGGGIPRRRITMLMGQSNAGKSYLASQAVVSVQKSGGNVFWIDNEISWDANWMEKCGVDVDNIHVAQPFTGEACFDMISDIMQTGLADIIVLDSLAGIVPAAVMEQEDFGYSPMAYQARFINQSLPRLMPYLKHGTAVVLINQTRETIGAAPALSNLPGGKGQVFFSHLILRLRRSGWITEGNDRVGFDVEIKNEKTKSGGFSQQSCIIPFKFDGGIDVVESDIREAIAAGFITRAGAWYQLPSGIKVMGMGGLKNHYCDKLEELSNMSKRDTHSSNLYLDEESEDVDDNADSTTN